MNKRGVWGEIGPGLEKVARVTESGRSARLKLRLDRCAMNKREVWREIGPGLEKIARVSGLAGGVLGLLLGLFPAVFGPRAPNRENLDF